MAALGVATALGVLSAADLPATRVVMLDALATDAVGRSVDTLTSADFDVRENGAAQAIDEVRFIRAGQERGGTPSAPIDSDADERIQAKQPGTRLVTVFLDDYHVSPANSARVRTAMLRFVDEYLAPNDLVFVMRPLDSLLKIRLTRDRERSRQAILEFSGRQGDYTPRNNYERNYISGIPARVDQQRAQIAISALNALALHMGRLDGDARKTLVVVSEELPSSGRRRGLEGLPTLDTIVRSANRYNVSVYSVNPTEHAATDSAAGSTPAAAREESDGLRSLAAATNGQFIGNSPDLAESMRPIASDSSGYYLLRYHTSNTDGKFHDVQVNVKRAGVSLRTRKGYWAVPSDEEIRLAAIQPKPKVVPEPPRHISPFIRPWFGAARGERGQTRVTFVWEPAGRIPGARQPIAAHVVLKALATDGTVLYDGSVLPTGPLGSDVLDATRVRADFDAPPGNLRLRMSIEDQTEQTIDSDVRDLSVRDLTAPVVLGTPAVFRGRTARDFRALANSADAAPVSSREFSRTERLVIRFPVYAPANATLEVQATLVNRKGQAMRPLSSSPVPARPGWREIDLPLAGFATGEYRIEIAARTPAVNATDSIDFRISN
jgi:VWFA-related protein